MISLWVLAVRLTSTGMLLCLLCAIAYMQEWSQKEAEAFCGAKAYVVQAEGQCRAGQLLAGLGLDISLPGIRAATPAAAKDVLMVLLAKLADTVPPLSESRSAHPFCSVVLLSWQANLAGAW